jgi:hypothetical protein
MFYPPTALSMFYLGLSVHLHDKGPIGWQRRKRV